MFNIMPEVGWEARKELEHEGPWAAWCTEMAGVLLSKDRGLETFIISFGDETELVTD